MSRGGGDDFEEGFPNQGAFWWTSARRALRGKRGKRALAELREALLMLPEKRLVAGAISTAAVKAKYESEPDLVDGPGGSLPNYGKKEALDKCETEGIGVCAIGAYLLRKRVLATGETPAEAMAALPTLADFEGYGLSDTALEGEDAGLTNSLAFLLADRNDETYADLTPEERYGAFLEWIDRELAEAL